MDPIFMSMKKFIFFTILYFSVFGGTSLYAESILGVTGEGRNLFPRITQAQVVSWPLTKIQENGVRIFSTPFNFNDGFGDERSTLQGNGTFLRVDGLDAQTCAECHFIKSNSTIPFTPGLGGTAGGGPNVLLAPTEIDAVGGNFNGRFINSPILFGVGGIELVAKEMTLELQKLMQEAIANPGVQIDLRTKGVFFGTIVADGGGDIDTSNVEGIDDDLIVRPFGRKGEFTTTRDFDIGALRFHFGMETVDEVGVDNDMDGDGIVNEITVGELSAVNIWVATRPRPHSMLLKKKARRGFELFKQIGCTYCHIPALQTHSRKLTFSFPEVPEDPTENVFYKVDLVKTSGFRPNELGGIVVPLFADLKRHDMGLGLAENFRFADGDFNAKFTTARLWGIADSGPYLHDGRALTITDAILALGGEAQPFRDNFVSLSQTDKNDVLDFLYSLRAPKLRQDLEENTKKGNAKHNTLR